MKNDPKIHEVAEMLGIPKHTLLYWEKEGLIHFDRDPVNGYRRISASTIYEIDQVVHYRLMGIPVAQIQQIPKMTLEDLRNLFEESNCRLDEKIHMLQAAQDRARTHTAYIGEILALTASPYQDEPPNFARVGAFRASEHWSTSNAQPDLFALVIHPDDPDSPLEGFVDDEHSQLLWERTEGEQWNVFVLKMELDNGKKKNSDLLFHLRQLRRLGYACDLVLARYMAEAAKGDKYYIYYKAWARVRQMPSE